MRAIVQRVEKGSVEVEGRPRANIGPGLVILVGVAQGDTKEDAEYLARKIAHLRIFPDEQRSMNRSILEAGGQALVVSQFTLYGDTRRGRRPSFSQAAAPEVAEPLYEHFVQSLAALGVPVATGEFQAHMLVAIYNDGPVTFIIDSPPPADAH